jgi:hypothetical protein
MGFQIWIRITRVAGRIRVYSKVNFEEFFIFSKLLFLTSPQDKSLRVREKNNFKKFSKNSIHRRYLDPDLQLEKILDRDPSETLAIGTVVI